MAKRKTINHAGVTGTRAVFLDAMRWIESRAIAEDPDPNFSRDGIKPGQWPGAPWDNLPPNCPVQVLGHNGDLIYCRSATGQLHEVERWDYPTLVKLFAPYINFLYWAWPGFGSGGKDADGQELPPIVKRVERDKAVTCLIAEGKRRGLFDPKKRVRGRGGWMAANGAFVWHSGERIWTVDSGLKLSCADPGEHDGDFYTKLPSVMEPWQMPVNILDTPASRILEDLKTWNWERPYLDPLLLLGWIGTAFMGGALANRPIVFTTGGAGVGKSTLHQVTEAILDDAVHALVDTTAAGIYQHVKHDSLPVTVDELEAKKGSTKATAVIELARLAFSGGKMARGGASHDGTTFQARSCFMFSAILHPPLAVQDKTRMAILNLRKLNKGHGREPVINDADGRMLLRQVMDGWTGFNTKILPDWRKTLHMAEFDARAISTYGTLLAAAELLVGPLAMEAIGLPVGDQHALAEMIQEATSVERAEQMEKWQECLEHLLAAPIEGYNGGQRMTVGSVLHEFENVGQTIEITRDKLALAGLGIRRAGDPGQGPCLAIPAQHPALGKIFQDTDFYDGGWINALKQGPDQVVLTKAPKNTKVVKISRVAKHCLLVDLGSYDAMMPKEQ
ncbi:hypothetical protein D5400_11680 [Georhizobium profundi]|uniref:DUF927 domain-containing protein n=1 Tax=Georhizobium profundi TaxID=2341112 RepID=A0A3Q8XNV1_9HYPH|nr:hypothetical protein [Georhizobium profundi]AZN71848.1 hypothetical protein D5400_11680 [Georhizobium profundi]